MKMKTVKSIESHLKPYSIRGKRETTINNAFASAIAPTDAYDEKKIATALKSLGQDPEDLTCIYCDKVAETWDHLINIVKNGELQGPGHQIGNLVPCCKECNSEKGAKDWREFINNNTLKRKLQVYMERYATPISLDKIKRDMPKEYAEYNNMKERILKLMEKADRVAVKIRDNYKG